MPSRKTRAQKELTGTLRKDREPDKPAHPRKGEASPPAWLSAAAQTAFLAIAREVQRCGIATGSFGHALTGAALAWVQLESDTAALANGSTYESETTNGARKILLRPEVHSRTASLRLLKAYLVELGLTPVSIGRVDLTAVPKPRSRDPGEQYFNDDTEEFLFGSRRAS